MASRVEISLQAEHDAEAILDWLLSQRSGEAGIEWFLALDDAFASLAQFPELAIGKLLRTLGRHALAELLLLPTQHLFGPGQIALRAIFETVDPLLPLWILFIQAGRILP